MHQHVGVTPTPRRPVSGTMAAGSLCPRWFMTAGASPLTSAFPQSAGHDLAPARRCALHLSTSSIRNTINENWAEDSVLGSRPGPPHQSFCCDNACCLPPPHRAALRFYDRCFAWSLHGCAHCVPRGRQVSYVTLTFSDTARERHQCSTTTLLLYYVDVCVDPSRVRGSAIIRDASSSL